MPQYNRDAVISMIEKVIERIESQSEATKQTYIKDFLAWKKQVGQRVDEWCQTYEPDLSGSHFSPVVPIPNGPYYRAPGSTALMKSWIVDLKQRRATKDGYITITNNGYDYSIHQIIASASQESTSK